MQVIPLFFQEVGSTYGDSKHTMPKSRVNSQAFSPSCRWKAHARAECVVPLIAIDRRLAKNRRQVFPSWFRKGSFWVVRLYSEQPKVQWFPMQSCFWEEGWTVEIEKRGSVVTMEITKEKKHTHKPAVMPWVGVKVSLLLFGGAKLVAVSRVTMFLSFVASLNGSVTEPFLATVVIESDAMSTCMEDVVFSGLLDCMAFVIVPAVVAAAAAASVVVVAATAARLAVVDVKAVSVLVEFGAVAPVAIAAATFVAGRSVVETTAASATVGATIAAVVGAAVGMDVGTLCVVMASDVGPK